MNRSQTIAQRSYRYSWISLFLLYPIVFFITPASAPALLWLPLLAAWRWVAYGRPIPKTPYNPPILLLTLMIGVSLWVTPDWPFSLPKVAGLLFGLATFYAVFDFNTLATAKAPRNGWTVTVLLLLAAGLILIGFAGFYPPIASRLPSVLQLGVNPNQVSGILTYSWPLLLAMAIWHGRQQALADGPQRVVHAGLAGALGVVALVGLLILYLTTSRGGQVACLLAAGVVLILSMRRFRIALFVASAVLLLAAVLYLTQFNTPPTSAEVGANATLQLTFSYRMALWSRGLEGIRDFPLTGMGMNIFRRAMPALYPLPGVSADVDLAHAHNHLLQAALDLGMPGLFAYLTIWAIAAYQLVQVWRAAINPRIQSLALGIAASLLAHFIFGVSDAIALGAKPGFLLWMLFGLAAALSTYNTTE